MNKTNHDAWFPAMRYGFGWGLPIRWQGWAVLLSYLALMLLGGLLVKKSPFLVVPFVICAFILSGLLVYICWKKGEKPEVRWGKN